MHFIPVSNSFEAKLMESWADPAEPWPEYKESAVSELLDAIISEPDVTLASPDYPHFHPSRDYTPLPPSADYVPVPNVENEVN